MFAGICPMDEGSLEEGKKKGGNSRCQSHGSHFSRPLDELFSPNFHKTQVLVSLRKT